MNGNQNHIASRGHTRPLTELHVVSDQDRTLLASSAHDKVPQIRNGDTGDWIGSFHGHKGAVWSIKIDTRSKTLVATASGDFTAKLWCLQTGKELHSLQHRHVVRSVDFSSDSMNLVSSSNDGLISLFDVCSLNSSPVCASMKQENSSDVATKIQFINDNKIILSGNKSGNLQLWDIRSSIQSPVRSLLIPGAGAIMDVDVNEANRLALVTSGNTVTKVNLDAFTVDRIYAMPTSLHFREEGGAALRQDCQKFLVGGSDLWIREVDCTSGEVTQVFKGHHGPIRCVRYHPNGVLGLSGSEDATIRIWDLGNSNSTNSSA